MYRVSFYHHLVIAKAGRVWGGGRVKYKMSYKCVGSVSIYILVVTKAKSKGGVKIQDMPQMYRVSLYKQFLVVIQCFR